MKRNSARMLSKRTQIVWASFFLVIPCALFTLQLGDDTIRGGILLTKLAPIDERPDQDVIASSIGEQSSWNKIVVHHLGQPAGSPESLERTHKESGLSGLGFHFLIGNGNGFGDGTVHIGYRWLNQLAGAKPIKHDAPLWNDETISICLVGNGNRRPFTEQQLVHLSHLVQRLQLALHIAPNNVYLAHELGDQTSSPGTYFAEAKFKSQLLDIPAQ